ncbi:MAG: hypothetical protein ACUVSX_11080 [Aggregatilineales bacterium]
MKIVGMYSFNFNEGEAAARQRCPALLAEVEEIISAVAGSALHEQTRIAKDDIRYL